MIFFMQTIFLHKQFKLSSFVRGLTFISLYKGHIATVEDPDHTEFVLCRVDNFFILSIYFPTSNIDISLCNALLFELCMGPATISTGWLNISFLISNNF